MRNIVWFLLISAIFAEIQDDEFFGNSIIKSLNHGYEIRDAEFILNLYDSSFFDDCEIGSYENSRDQLELELATSKNITFNFLNAKTISSNFFKIKFQKSGSSKTGEMTIQIKDDIPSIIRSKNDKCALF
ncbi:unnamed protein product [Caenorhabditis angaria]|uniref:Uncharacterized protein n=1 Tax=Caenorhabditis angaria TaxID=860376 RepID=A0A9P1N5K9_9PELO|nr:unnamed protein product [Caenorhabditis angaria]